MYGGLLDPKRFFNFAQTVQFSCKINVPLFDDVYKRKYNFQFMHYFKMVTNYFFTRPNQSTKDIFYKMLELGQG